MRYLKGLFVILIAGCGHNSKKMNAAINDSKKQLECPQGLAQVDKWYRVGGFQLKDDKHLLICALDKNSDFDLYRDYKIYLLNESNKDFTVVETNESSNWVKFHFFPDRSQFSVTSVLFSPNDPVNLMSDSFACKESTCKKVDSQCMHKKWVSPGFLIAYPFDRDNLVTKWKPLYEYEVIYRATKGESQFGEFILQFDKGTGQRNRFLEGLRERFIIFQHSCGF